MQNYLKPSKQDLWIPKKPPKEIIRGVWNENYLKRLHETLKHFRHKKKNQKKYLEESLSEKNKRISLSLTLQAPDDHDDKINQNEILIQKTIKGRAIQSMLQKGMKKIQDVVQETKNTHSIASVKNIFPKEFCQQIDYQKEIMTEYMQLEELLKKDSKLQKELENIESQDVRYLLNYFQKELNRLNNEKQAHALYLLVERERYRREAENFGEMNCEKQFRDDSMTVYLENILLEGINRAFDENSRLVIKEMARNIDKKADKRVTFDKNGSNFLDESISKNEQLEIFEASNNLSNREIITNLLKTGIISQKMHEIKSKKYISLQQQYLIEAHHYLYKEEYENFRKEEELFLCSSIFNEMLENAIGSFEHKLDEEKLLHQQSEDAEFLATKIVEEILNSIVCNEKKDEFYKSFDDCDEDISSNQQAEFKAKIIDDDLLAEVVTQDILKSVILSSSSSEKSGMGDF